ncbi:MAG: outer membrane protein assembly factor BamA [Kofleriaceae bacterium]
MLACAANAAAETTIERVDIVGTHRIEPDAVRLQVASKRGQVLDPIKVREDIRSLWRLGAFSNVSVSMAAHESGNVVLAFEVVERPTIRKVYVANNHELSLDKINDVLDLHRDTILDVAEIHRNRDKVAELYLAQGFLMSTVAVEILPVGATEVDVRYVVDEHAKVRVADVQFTGNHAVSDSDLRDAMVTRRPGALSFMNDSGLYRRDGLERDIAILSGLYIDRGYATVKIGAPALRLSRDRKYMYVTLTIDEGPKFAFGAVTIKGDLLGTLASHQAQMKSQTGATFSRSVVDADRKRLEARYQDQGFANVNVVPRMRLDHVNRRVELGFEIVRGKRVYIERIHIRGNSKTRDKVIRRELKISEGEQFNGSNLERSRRRVGALGYFENVVITTQAGSSEEFVDVNIEVRERPTGNIQIGAGFSSVESFIVQGQAAQENFLGRGHSVAFSAQISSLRRIFSLRFVEPYFLDTHWSFSTELYNTSRGLGAYSRNATGGALTWGYPLGDHARAAVTYRLEDVSISSGSGGIANFGARSTTLPTIGTADLMRGGLTSSIRGSLGWDSRNNRLLPTEGWYANAFAEYAGKITGSDNQFVRWGGFLRRYHHIGGPFTLRLNGEFGVTTSLDGRGVPLTERYLLGGIYDIRGYLPRSIGPQLLVQRPGDIGHELDPLPLGGNLQLVGNAEIEFPVAKKLGLSGVVFFDIGNAYNLEDRYCGGSQIASVDACVKSSGMLGGLRKSVGVGVRWQSPIGPLRFEWGIPLDLRPGEKPSGLDFTIGTSF